MTIGAILSWNRGLYCLKGKLVKIQHGPATVKVSKPRSHCTSVWEGSVYVNT